MKKINRTNKSIVCLLSLFMTMSCLNVYAEEKSEEFTETEMISQAEAGLNDTETGLSEYEANTTVYADNIIAYDNEFIMKPGKTKQLAYQLEPETSDEKPVFRLNYANNNCITVDENGFVKAVTYGGASVIAEISNGNSAWYQIYVPKDPTSLTFNENSHPGIKGQLKTLSVQAFPLEADHCRRHIESSNPSVAKVMDEWIYSTSGFDIECVSAGTATITATADNGVKAEFALTVIEGDYAQFINKTSYDTINMRPGDTKQLEYTLYSYDSGPEFKDEKVTFSIEYGEEYASVSDEGLVTALKGGGTARVCASITNGDSVSYEISVSDLPTSIAFEKSEYVIAVGESKYFRVLTEPDSASNCQITYTSSDTSVASIEHDHGSNQIRGYKEGLAVITAETENGLTAQTVARIVDGYATGISISDRDMYLSLNESKQVEYQMTSNTGNTSKEQLKWSVEKGDEVISVDQDGVITALGYGQAILTVETVLGSTARANVYVAKLPESLHFPVESYMLPAGKNLNIFALSDSPDSDNCHLIYTSDNPTVADVVDYGNGGVGWVLSKSPGTAVITAAADNGVSAKLKVIVEEGEFNREPFPSGQNEVLSIGEQVDLSRYGGQNLIVSDSSVAVINNGYLTALQPGEVYVYTVDDNGHFLGGIMRVFVHTQLSSISFKSDHYYLYKGSSLALREVLDLSPEDELVDDIQFVSSNENAVQVSNFQICEAKAVNNGTAVITAYTDDGLTASTMIHVGSQLKATSIELTEAEPVTLNLNFNRIPALKISPIYTDQNDYSLVSDHPEIVGINTTWNTDHQKLKGKKIGTAIVTATLKSDPSKSVSFPVTVTDGEGRDWHEKATLINTTTAFNEMLEQDENGEYICYTGDEYTIFSNYIATRLVNEDTLDPSQSSISYTSSSGSIKMYPPQGGRSGALGIFDEGYDWMVFTAIRPGTAKIYIAGNKYITVRVKNREKENKIDIYGCSLNLNGKVGINYYLDMPEEEIEDLSIILTRNGQETVIPASEGAVKTVDGKQYRMYMYETAAKEMRDDIILTVKDGEGNPVKLAKDGEDYTEGYIFSAKAYFEKARETDNEKLKALVNALETYGKYAQIYFKYHTEQVGEMEDVSSVTADMLKRYRPLTAGSCEGLNYVGGSLELSSNTSVRIYYSLDEGYSISGYEFGINGDPAAAQLRTGRQYYVFLDDIAAQDLHKALTVTAEKGDEIITTIYYPLSYAYSALTSDKASEEIRKTCQALYLYNQAAIAYFQK